MTGASPLTFKIDRPKKPIPKRVCGSCTACCKTMGVPDHPAGPKALHTWCQDCLIGTGCSIYETRPETCRDFSCLWLQLPAIMPDQMRPDRIKVVFTPTPDGTGVIAHCDPATPMSWREPRPMRSLKAVAAGGNQAMARSGLRYWIITHTMEWEVPEEYIDRADCDRVAINIPAEVARKIGAVSRKA